MTVSHLTRFAVSVTLMSAANPLLSPIARAQTMSSSPAADSLQEVVVVARKRAENLQDVPVSITALSASDLANAKIDRVNDLIAVVPNMTQDGAGDALGAYGLRGVVSATRNIGFDSGLGIYVDGVLVVRPNAGDQELPDVSSVEVLRGPQGTLFGRNTTAGAINIITRQPSQTPTGDFKATLGNFNDREFSGYLSGPLKEEILAGKISVYDNQRDGYIRNEFDGKHYNGIDHKGVRGSLLFTPDEDLSLTWTANYERNRDIALYGGGPANNTTGAFAGLPGYTGNPYLVDVNNPSFQNRDAWGTNMKAVWKLNERLQITSITAYGWLKTDFQDDDDARPLLGSNSHFIDAAHQVTQEIRLESSKTEKYDYLLGVYYLNQKATANRDTTVLVPTGSDITSNSGLDTDAYAVFASGNWRPAERLSIGGGVRYNSERKALQFEQTNTSVIPLPDLTADLTNNFTAVTGNISATFNITDTVNVYANVSRGFKSGGFNPDIVGDTNISFGPEHVTAYEIGAKSEFLDRRVRLNAALFYSDFSDLQVSQLVGVAFQIRNAAGAHIKGGELELEAAPIRGLTANVGVGYTDATFTQFNNCAAGVNCNGYTLPFVPKLTVNAAIQYQYPIGQDSVITRLDYSYKASTFAEATDDPTGYVNSYGLANGRLGYEFSGGRYGVYLWTKNIFDKVYKQYSWFYAPFAQREFLYAIPRTYGVELSAHF